MSELVTRNILNIDGLRIEFKVDMVKIDGTIHEDLAFPFTVRARCFKRLSIPSAYGIWLKGPPNGNNFIHWNESQERIEMGIWYNGGTLAAMVEDTDRLMKKFGYGENGNDDAALVLKNPFPLTKKFKDVFKHSYQTTDNHTLALIDYFNDRLPDTYTDVDRFVITMDNNEPGQSLTRASDQNYEEQIIKHDSFRNSITIDEQGEEDGMTTALFGVVPEGVEGETPLEDVEIFLSDLDDISTNFSSVQPEVCDSFEEEERIQVKEILKMCPTCIPNPDAQIISVNSTYLMLGDVWLDERVCEYRCKIVIDGYSATPNGDPIPWISIERDDYANDENHLTGVENRQTLIRESLMEILADRGKIVSDEIICSNPPLSAGEECGDLPLVQIITEQEDSGQNDGISITKYQILAKNIRNPYGLELYASIVAEEDPLPSANAYFGYVSIPADLVDRIADNLLAEEIEAAEEDEVQAGSNNNFVEFLEPENIKRNLDKNVPNMFKTFAEYQSFLLHTQNGRLKIDSNFNSGGSLVPFYISRYVKKFELFFSDLQDLLSENDFRLTSRKKAFKQPSKIKIIFKTVNGNPFVIKNVKAAYKNCPYQKCSKGLGQFMRKYENEGTLMAYISQYTEIVESAETNQTPPWLEFIVDRTRPSITVVYGSPLAGIEAQGCLSSNTDTMAEIVEDLILETEMSFSKALEYAMNSLNCRTIDKYDQSEYWKAIGEMIGDEFANQELEKVLANYRKLGNGITKEWGEFTEKVQKIYKKMLKDKQQPERKFFERMTGMTIREMREKTKVKNWKDKDVVGKVVSKISPCNFSALQMDIIKCMMKGLNPLEVLKKAASALLGEMGPKQLELYYTKYINKLDPAVKAELEAFFEAYPKPWELAAQEEQKKKDNKYEEERDNPQNPATAQVTQGEIDSLQDMNDNSEALKKEIIDLQYDLSVLETQLDGLTTDLSFALETGGDSLNNQIDAKEQEIDAKKSEIDAKKAELNETKYAILDEMIATADESKGSKMIKDLIVALSKIYIDKLVDAISGSDSAEDLLKELIDSLPGSEIFVPILMSATCPAQEMLDTWAEAAWSGLEIDPCKKSTWTIPDIPEFPELEFVKIFKNLLEEFMKKMINRLVAALVSFLMRTLEKLLNSLCDVFEGIGSHFLGNDDNDNSLFDAIADAFCKEDPPYSAFSNSFPRDGTAVDTLSDMFSAYSSPTRVSSDTIVSWGAAISQNISLPQIQRIFVEGGIGDDEIYKWWDITSQFPEITDELIDTPEKLADFLSMISGFISDEWKQNISNAFNSLDPGINLGVDPCDLYCADLTYGINTIDDSYGIFPSTKGFENDFMDLIRDFYNGPDSAIYAAMDMDPDYFSTDPFCSDIRDLYNSDNLTGKQSLLTETAVLKESREAATSAMLASIEMAYNRDLIVSKDSFFNNLLADKSNDPLSKGGLFNLSHQFKVRTRFLFPNAADTKKQFNNKWATAKFPLRLIMRMADAFQDAVKEINEDLEEIPEDSGGPLAAIWDKIKGLLKSIIKKPFRRFLKLFTIKPSPTNLLPKTVGKQFSKSLSDTTIWYKTSLQLDNDIEYYTVEPKDLPGGLTTNSFKVYTKPFTKGDVRTTYSTPGGDYLCHTYFSPYTLESIFDHSNPSFNVDEEKYHIIVKEVTTAKPTLMEFFNSEDSEKVKPENGMTEAQLSALNNLTSDEAGQSSEIMHNIHVPYNTKRYETFYSNFKLFYTIEVGAEAEGEVFSIPPNQWCLSEYMKRGMTIKIPSIDNIGSKYNLSHNTFDSDSDEYYTSRKKYDRVYQDIMKNFTAGIFALADIKIEQNGIQSLLTPPTFETDQPGTNLTNAFSYGYKKNSKIQYADLLYVNPEATTDVRTWYYDKEEEQQILGKSATGNQRVNFLNPMEYGGSYKKPKIYIEPAKHKGILGALQYFVPEIDGCEPSRDGKLFLSEIMKRISDLEISITSDKRLSYDPDCTKEPPFDLIVDRSAHAHLHGIVVLTIRTYILDFILRTLPIIMLVPPKPGNYDDIFYNFIIDTMEKGLKDTPRKTFGFDKIKQDEYWYLFLEQMVQAVEREILSGVITKNDELDSLFNDIKNIKQNYTQPSRRDRKILRQTERVYFDGSGNVYKILFNSGDIINNQSGPLFDKYKTFIEAVQFDALGENFKGMLSNLDIKMNVGLLSIKKLRRLCKKYAIYLNQETAKQISKYLIEIEIAKYLDIFEKDMSRVGTKNDEIQISSITKYALNPRSNLCLGTKDKPCNVGLSFVENKIFSDVTNSDFGDCLDLKHEYYVEDLYGDLESLGTYENEYKRTKLVLQKYVITYVKSDGIGTNDANGDPADDLVTLAFSPVYGIPISIEEFQERWSVVRNDLAISFTDDVLISDYFGNAVDGEYPDNDQTIGIKFGVRLSLMTPHWGTPPDGYFSSTTEWMFGKYGQIEIRTQDNPSNGDKYFLSHLHSFEMDVMDQPLAQYVNTKVFTDNAGENLKCYVDRLCELENFKYITEYLLPIKGTLSTTLLNSYYSYIASIGKDESERYDWAFRANESWKGEVLYNTKEELRKMFKEYYLSREIDFSDDASKKAMSELLRLNMPDVSLNIDFKSIRWWQRKRFENRPFDENENSCSEGSLSVFNQEEPGPTGPAEPINMQDEE